MSKGEGKSTPALGFLTVVRHELHGLFGGYLVLNLSGRPLEFHCTTPIKPNRAQEILYGPTLEPFLYGEQIGQTLVAKAEISPLALLTDVPPALAVRVHVGVPVGLVVAPESRASVASNPADARSDPGDRTESEPTTVEPRAPATAAAIASSPLAGPHFALGRNRLAVGLAFRDDRDLLAERLAAVAEGFDLAEPFDRIRGAIEEAQRGGRS